jgi:Fic family protein
MSAQLGRLIAAVRVAPPQATMARAWREIRREDITQSTALAGSALDRPAINALLDRGIASGDYPLADYLLVRDYAIAADYSASRLPFATGDPRPLLALADIRQFHALAARSESGAPGAWRSATVSLADGVVAPPPWLVPREVDAFLERFSHALPDEDTARWVASAIARFTRILPFANANGRIARLIANALLARRGLPPLVIPAREHDAYQPAIDSAHAGDAKRLERIVERALVHTIEALLASRASDDPADDLVPLASIVPRNHIARYYKAAQRGRLRHTLRDGRLYVTRRWLADYTS